MSCMKHPESKGCCSLSGPGKYRLLSLQGDNLHSALRFLLFFSESFKERNAVALALLRFFHLLCVPASRLTPLLCSSTSACTTRSETRWGLSAFLPNPSNCFAAAGFPFLCLSSQLPAPLWFLLLLSGAGALRRWACWDLQQHQGVASNTHPSNLVLPAGGSGSSEELWGLRCSSLQAEPPRGSS